MTGPAPSLRTPAAPAAAVPHGCADADPSSLSTAAQAADRVDAVAARARTDAAAGPDSDSARICLDAEELLRRGRHGQVMTQDVARYRQLELAQLLHAIARGVEVGDPLPHGLVRHAANLSRHILSYPPSSSPVATTT